MRRSLCTAAALAAVLAFSAPAIASAEILYVHAGKLVDTIAGKVLDDQLIKIDGERVVSVTPWKAAPTDGKVIDWSRRMVLPLSLIHI